MELKEAIKILEEFLLILGSEYCYIDNRDTTKEEQAMETVLKYIKEESIPRAKIRDVQRLIEFGLQQEYKEFEKNSTWLTLQSLLNKGE
jgi:hypothetical protein